MSRRTTAIAEAPQSFALALIAFLTFLRRPRLDQRLEIAISRSTLLISLLILSFAVTAISAVFALPFIVSSDVSLGDNLRNVSKQSAMSVFVAIVILGPIIEEMIFRGWLVGTLPAIAGSAVFLAIVYGGSWMVGHFTPDAVRLGAQVGLVILGLSAFRLIQRKSRGTRSVVYERAFPVVFWLQGIVFGGLHAANLATESLAMSMLSVLPLIVCGWLWGYARIKLDFGAACVLHMIYNVPPAIATIVMI